MNIAVKSYHIYRCKIESNLRKLYFVESLVVKPGDSESYIQGRFIEWVIRKGQIGTHYILEIELFCTVDSFVSDENI